MTLEIIPVCFEDQVTPDTDLASLILSKIDLVENDILVVSQKIISKQEGRIIELDSVVPSILAEGISAAYDKDPRIVELILSESERIVRMQRGIIIVKTHHGFVCANAGIDESNIELGHATLLPVDSDTSAHKLRNQLFAKSGKNIAVLISDTFGRPFRTGQTDCAIGSSGLNTIRDYRGLHDTMGRKLRVSEIAIADEICAAAELVKGKSSNCPVAIIRNFEFESRDTLIGTLLRHQDEDLFAGCANSDVL